VTRTLVLLWNIIKDSTHASELPRVKQL